MAATLQTFGGGTTDFILDPGNGAKPLPNTPYTIIDAATMLPATGLQDASGAAVTQLTSDGVGRFAGSALLEGAEFYLNANGSDGVVYTFGPMVSTTAVADTVGLAPQLNSIASSAAASAFSAKSAQSAAEAAAAGATAPAATAIDSRLGGNTAGLVPRVAANETRLAFDITKITPTRMTSLQLAGASVLQFAYKQPETGDFYATQAKTGTQADRETVTLSRCAADGTLLDSMILTDAGHGTTIGVEYAAGSTYIWISWQEALASGSGNDVVRFLYRPGATLTRAETQYFTVIPKFAAAGTYTNVSMDWANDWFAQRVTAGNTETYYRRKISEVLANVDKTYGTIGPISVNPPTMQGFATIDDSMYFYSGTSDVTLSNRQITRYSWTTGQITGVVDTNTLGKLPDGTTFGDFREPEGVSLYRDPATGLPALLCGVTTGYTNARVYQLYMFAPVGADKHRGAQLRKLEDMTTYLKSGKSRRLTQLPSGVTAISGISKPGWFYLTTAEFTAMTDKPTDAPLAGFFVEVSSTDSGSAIVQRLIRNSSTTADQWVRVCTPGGTSGPWLRSLTTLDLTATVPTVNQLSQSVTLTSWVNGATVFSQESSSNAHDIWVAPFPCKIVAVTAVWSYYNAALNATDYWTFDLAKYTGSTNVIVSKGTQTGGAGAEAIVARSAWRFAAQTWNATNAAMAEGDVLQFRATKFGAAAVHQLPVTVTFRYVPV